MYIETPATILYDEAAQQMAVTASTTLPTGQSGFILAGITNANIVQYMRMDSSGSQVITGTIGGTVTIANPVTSMTVLNPVNTVTMSNPVTAVTASQGLSGSIPWKVEVQSGGAALGSATNPFISKTVEPATFTVTASSVATANNKSMISLFNSGSSVVKIRQLSIINSLTAVNLLPAIGNFELRRNGGHSGGTIVNPQTHDSTDSLPSTITTRTGAVIASAGATIRKWMWTNDQMVAGTLSLAASDHTYQSLIPGYNWQSGWKPITIRIGEGVDVLYSTNNGNGSFDFVITFTVE